MAGCAARIVRRHFACEQDGFHGVSFLTTDASNGHVRTSLLGVGELYAPDGVRCASRCGRSRGRRA